LVDGTELEDSQKQRIHPEAFHLTLVNGNRQNDGIVEVVAIYSVT